MNRSKPKWTYRYPFAGNSFQLWSCHLHNSGEHTPREKFKSSPDGQWSILAKWDWLTGRRRARSNWHTSRYARKTVAFYIFFSRNHKYVLAQWFFTAGIADQSSYIVWTFQFLRTSTSAPNSNCCALWLAHEHGDNMLKRKNRFGGVQSNSIKEYE